MIKQTFSKAIEKLGYRIVKLSTKEPIIAEFGPEEKKILDFVGPYTMTSPERILSLIQAVKYVVKNQIEGDVVECGVWKGGSSMATALSLLDIADTSRHIYLYDTFEGMPLPSKHDVKYNGHQAAATFKTNMINENSSDWCRAALDEVKANLMSTGYPFEKLHFIKGKVEETIPRIIPRKIAILRLDTDWYESTKHEMEHLFPLLSNGGVLIVDDYGHWQGSKKAIDEYIAEQNIPLFLNRIDFTGRLAIKPSLSTFSENKELM